MTAAAAVTPINYHYGMNGEVRCSNVRGLTFFLVAEPPLKAPAREWVPMEALVEVEAKRQQRPQPVAEATRKAAAEPLPAQSTFKVVEATREVEVRRTGELPAAPAPSPAPAPAPAAPAKAGGWFGKLFKK